ncbi:hypothetical protein HK101_008222 [Irineochytrium annulatum]|nr:hypothetical protein HK101_008222 [Irineochytrium annulatum]
MEGVCANLGQLARLDLVTGAFKSFAEFAQPPDRMSPIAPDGSGVLLTRDDNIIVVIFKAAEEGENAEEQDGGKAVPEEEDDHGRANLWEGGDEDQASKMVALEDDPQVQKWITSTTTLLLENRMVWKQERVNGKLKNHILHVWGPVGFRSV